MKKNEHKKKYSTPRLVKYGDFKKLTAGSKATAIEGGGAGGNKTKTGGDDQFCATHREIV